MESRKSWSRPCAASSFWSLLPLPVRFWQILFFLPSLFLISFYRITSQRSGIGQSMFGGNFEEKRMGQRSWTQKMWKVEGNRIVGSDQFIKNYVILLFFAFFSGFGTNLVDTKEKRDLKRTKFDRISLLRSKFLQRCWEMGILSTVHRISDIRYPKSPCNSNKNSG